MKNVSELKATLNMVLARLESEPTSAEEWRIITGDIAPSTELTVELLQLVQGFIEDKQSMQRRFTDAQDRLKNLGQTVAGLSKLVLNAQQTLQGEEESDSGEEEDY